MKIYELHAEDMSHLGSPMGTEYTESIFSRYFSKIEYAKEAAEKDFNVGKKKLRKISWSKDKKHPDEFTSGDLGWVMYTITPVKVEK